MKGKSRILLPVICAACSLNAIAQTHIVSKGETLYSISRMYGMSVDELKRRNAMKDTDVLVAGSKLNLGVAEDAPYTSKYTVAKGDTYYNIAHRYGIEVAALLSMNGFTKERTLRLGETILVPSTYGDSYASKASVTARPAVPKEPSVPVPSKSNTSAPSTYGIKDNTVGAKEDLRVPTPSSPVVSMGAGAKKGITEPILAPIDADGALTTSAKSAINLEAANSSVKKLSTKKDLALSGLTVMDTKAALAPIKKGDPNLVWPVLRPDVSYTNTKLYGVVLEAKGGEAVSAIKAGTVVYCGLYRGYGQVVFIQSKTGHIFSYIGLDSICVKKGDKIAFKDKLGTVGIDVISLKPQMTLMVFQNGKPIDPAIAPRG